MLSSVLYNSKQLLPRRLQIAMRRARAKRRFAQAGDSWPIRSDAGVPPEGWPGWPDGHRFALVLTHDVDTARGLARCSELARLERERGFRSAFYFVPEGRYTLQDDLRESLARDGFEVGVHGLYHDWKTFLSRGVFERRASRIRDYAKQWKAGGFRAPSMIRNLDWIGELGFDYDSSSFDNDPFEPQPQSAGTIFPYWVQSRTTGKKYVEMPYTLPQDHTLYVILQERGADVWKKKLDWIAAHGGMAMPIVHPDYLCLHGKPGFEEFPVEWYLEFLDYVKQNYSGRYWSALPHEVAAYFRQACAGQKPRSRRRVAMAAYAYYDTDNRIIRYAETLARRGDEVDVIALRRPGQPREGFLNGVRVSRIQQRQRNERFAVTYLFRMFSFLVRSSALLLWRAARRRYDVVHVHSVPDFEVFSAMGPRWCGAGVMLDIHDLSPEFYASKFGIGVKHLIVRFLQWVERISCRYADHVIVANDLWRERLVERSVKADRCSVVLNHVDRRFLDSVHRPEVDGRFRIVYPGGLQWHQGLDIAIEAFARVCDSIPGAEFLIYGEGSDKHRLLGVVERLRIGERVKFRDPVPFETIPSLLAEADLGVVAKRADSFGNEAFSTKILEFMSQGVPVICSRTAIDQYYFTDQLVRFFPSGNVEELAQAILEMAHNPETRKKYVTAGREYVAQNNWEIHKQAYLDLVDRLAEKS